MGAIDVDAPPTTAPIDSGLPTPETRPGGVPSEPDRSTTRRRWVRLGAVVAGLVIVVVVGVLIWLLWLNPPPQPPDSLRVESTQSDSVGLRWDAAGDGPDAESYVILNGEQELGSVDAPTTSFIVTGLTPNSRYELSVVSVDGDRRSEPSEPIAVTTDPARPASLQIENRAATSVRLQWEEPDDGPRVESYVILNGEQELGSVDAPTTSFIVTELTPNTRYELSVVSVDADRRSEPSEPIAVTTDPARPASLQIADRTATSVTLRWDHPPGASADSYVILNDGDELGVVPHPETSFGINDLIPGASYDFGVAARAGARRSVAALTTVTTTAPMPGALASDPAGNTTDTIVVTWSAPADVGAATEYVVSRDGETVANVPGDTFSYTDTGLAPATAYEYRVSAHWGYETSEPSEAIEVATAEPPVGDARLAGSWPVDVTIVADPGANVDVGTTWTTTWDFEPSCDAGACNVILAGDNSPPGFNYKSFTIDLVREGASYTGSNTAQITYCNSVAVENTVTAQLTVDTAGVQGGTWVASSWIGTLEISSPYTEVGDYYCSSQTVREDLSAKR